MIQEDWERIFEIEKTYILASKMEEENNWRQYIESQEKLPADIQIIIPKLQENEDHSISFF